MAITVYERYNQLNVDFSYIGLEKSNAARGCCDPIGIKTFAALGVDGIHFGFIDGFGEMVFSVNPFAYKNQDVNPLAYTFKDFLRLVLACKTADRVEQIYCQTKEQFYKFLEDDLNDIYVEQETALSIIHSELGIEPMIYPYEYVREVQASFDYSQIKYSNEYYELTGIDKPSK